MEEDGIKGKAMNIYIYDTLWVLGTTSFVLFVTMNVILAGHH